MIWILLLPLLAIALCALGIYALATAQPDPFDGPEHVPETPTLPPAVVIHLSVGDRLQDRKPWEDVERARMAGRN